MDTNGDAALRRNLKMLLLGAVSEAQAAAKRLSQTAVDMGRSEDYQKGVRDASEAMVNVLADFLIDRV